MANHTLALIAANPGPLQDGLHALLMNVPQIQIIRQANDTSTALTMIAEQRPALILLDANLFSNGSLSTLQQIKAEQGQRSRYLVLADDSQQQSQATAAGADVAIVKGSPAKELFNAIQQLISEQAPGRN